MSSYAVLCCGCVLCRVFWMVEASIHMCMCEIIVGVVLATQMDPVTGVLSQAATIGLIVVVSGLLGCGGGGGGPTHRQAPQASLCGWCFEHLGLFGRGECDWVGGGCRG
jgi:hypothetical protein